MTDFAISVETAPDPRDVEALGRGLTEHALPTTGTPGFQPLAVFARDRDGRLVGGMHGHVNWTWLHIGARLGVERAPPSGPRLQVARGDRDGGGRARVPPRPSRHVQLPGPSVLRAPRLCSSSRRSRTIRPATGASSLKKSLGRLAPPDRATSATHAGRARRSATRAGTSRHIYAEIRRLWAVPYVSSLQRHLATRDGWLEWVWAAIGPVVRDGRAQTAAWRAVEHVDVPALPPISRDALGVWGVDAAGEATIGAVCASFVRVSPVNLVFVRPLAPTARRSIGRRRSPAAPPRWTPPPALPPLPALVDLARALAGRARRADVARPRRWAARRSSPGCTGCSRSGPRCPRPSGDGATAPPRRTRATAMRRSARSMRPSTRRSRPSSPRCRPLPAAPPMPSPTEFAGVLAALDTYRKTSPEMVVFGRMIGRALPVEQAADFARPRVSGTGLPRTAGAPRIATAPRRPRYHARCHRPRAHEPGAGALPPEAE